MALWGSFGVLRGCWLDFVFLWGLLGGMGWGAGIGGIAVIVWRNLWVGALSWFSGYCRRDAGILTRHCGIAGLA